MAVKLADILRETEPLEPLAVPLKAVAHRRHVLSGVRQDISGRLHFNEDAEDGATEVEIYAAR
jgi:hypothetical protein